MNRESWSGQEAPERISVRKVQSLFLARLPTTILEEITRIPFQTLTPIEGNCSANDQQQHVARIREGKLPVETKINEGREYLCI